MISLFSLSTLACVNSYLFNDGNFNRDEVIPHCGFNLHCPNYWWWWVFFYLPNHLSYIFWRNVCSGLLPIFLIGLGFLLFCLFWYWVMIRIFFFWHLTSQALFSLGVFIVLKFYIVNSITFINKTVLLVYSIINPFW